MYRYCFNIYLEGIMQNYFDKQLSQINAINFDIKSIEQTFSSSNKFHYQDTLNVSFNEFVCMIKLLHFCSYFNIRCNSIQHPQVLFIRPYLF